MPLDPQLQALLDAMPAFPDDPWALEPAAIRPLTNLVDPSAPRAEVGAVEDLEVAGADGPIAARRYRPHGEGPFPLLVYFHGGGFVLCGLDSHDAVCRELCAGAGVSVLSVDYRLAPEAKFPAAPEDCFAATTWAVGHAERLDADASRLAVGGDSAGGNLAAVVAQLLRDRGGPALAHQLLVYPVVEYGFTRPSYRENAKAPVLGAEMMKWFWAQYLEDETQGADPLASPIRADDLSGLPPATLITAEYDPLRDEGEAYAAALEAAGVATALRRYEGMAHGFFSMSAGVDRAREAVDWACARLREALHPPAAATGSQGR